MKRHYILQPLAVLDFRSSLLTISTLSDSQFQNLEERSVIIHLNPRDKKLSPICRQETLLWAYLYRTIERKNIKIMNPLWRAMGQTKHSLPN
jgi:hypothetical protein